MGQTDGFTASSWLVRQVASIMHLLEDKGKRLRSKKGLVVDD